MIGNIINITSKLSHLALRLPAVTTGTGTYLLYIYSLLCTPISFPSLHLITYFFYIFLHLVLLLCSPKVRSYIISRPSVNLFTFEKRIDGKSKNMKTCLQVFFLRAPLAVIEPIPKTSKESMTKPVNHTMGTAYWDHLRTRLGWFK